MSAIPILDSRALKIEIDEERVLVAADLHLGIEVELSKRGISLPSQMSKVKERLLKLINQENPDRLILLGDVKHNIPITSWQEQRELPGFFEEIGERVKVEILPGNHDGNIRSLVPKSTTVHNAHGIVIGKEKRIGLMHGHAWPDPKLLKTDTIVTGHNHPAIEFRDELGARMTEPVWMRYKIDSLKLPNKLQREIDGEGPEFLVCPAFSELISGATLNQRPPEEIPGPIFKSGAAKTNEAEIYLLDGTFLGTLGTLKKMLEEG